MTTAAQRVVLVLNVGSSSVKYQLVAPDPGTALAEGIVEEIGERLSSARLVVGDQLLTQRVRVADHDAALRLAVAMLAQAGVDLATAGLSAVGHRVVHGGAQFYRPTLITDQVIAALKALSSLAPVHNPPAVRGIELARAMLPDVRHIAVFDTAYFHQLPAAAATYPIDRELAQSWQIRRYGFHGTSHQYVSEQAAAFLGRPLETLNQIVLHLGSGASAAAIAGGRPVDTSMGLTPLEGLMMGTRSGDLDPGIIGYLNRAAGMAVDDIESMLNHRSGVYGLAGEADFRRLHDMIESGDESAQLAYSVFIHRLRKYIGGYLAVLGHTNVVSFTAGIGVHDPAVRRDALSQMTALGIELDEQRNASPVTSAWRISTARSPITVLVIPTNEELAIARQCLAVIGS